MTVPLTEIHPTPVEKTVGHGYIGMLDAVGFADAVGRTEGKDDLVLLDFYQACKLGALEFPEIRIVFLSDTCFAFAPDGQLDNLLRFSSQVVLAAFADGIPMRGAVSKGNFTLGDTDSSFPPPPNFYGKLLYGTGVTAASDLYKTRRGIRLLLDPALVSQTQETRTWLSLDRTPPEVCWACFDRFRPDGKPAPDAHRRIAYSLLGEAILQTEQKNPEGAIARMHGFVALGIKDSTHRTAAVEALFKLREVVAASVLDCFMTSMARGLKDDGEPLLGMWAAASQDIEMSG